VQEKKSNMNIVKTFINYCKACYEELAHKTTWPTRKELTQSAVLVLTASLIIAVVVWVMDVLFKAVMSSIYTI
jgi:preprotein translocase subunit SecE